MSATRMRLSGAPISWPYYMQGAYYPVQGGAAIINAATQRYSMQGTVRWPDRGTHDIQSIEYWNGDGLPGTGNTVRVSLQALASGVSPIQPDGVVDEFATQTNPGQNAYHKLTLNTPRLAVAHGTSLAVVFDVTVFGSGLDWRPTGWAHYDGRPVSRWQDASYNGSVWSAVSRSPGVLFRSSDGAVGTLGPLFPVRWNSTGESWNSSSTPDERGLEFVPEAAWEIDALWFCGHPASQTDGNFELILYENSTAVETVTVSPRSFSTLNYLMAEYHIPPRILSPANTYRLVLKPGATNVLLTVMSLDAADIRAFHCGLNAGYAARTDGGDWAGRVDTKAPFCGVRISGMVAGAPLPGQHIRFV